MPWLLCNGCRNSAVVFCIEEHVAEFVKQCLHCMDSKAGEKVPRPLGETVHGTRPGEVVHTTNSMLERAGRWETMAWMRTRATDTSSS